MNDFTKEELQFIAIALERFSVKEPGLEKQIQSMIDNYHCQIIKAWHCEKCGHVQ